MSTLRHTDWWNTEFQNTPNYLAQQPIEKCTEPILEEELHSCAQRTGPKILAWHVGDPEGAILTPLGVHKLPLSVRTHSLSGCHQD